MPFTIRHISGSWLDCRSHSHLATFATQVRFRGMSRPERRSCIRQLLQEEETSMQKLLSSLTVAILLCAGMASARADGDAHHAASDAIRTWNNLALGAVRTAKSADGDAARTYAMVNVAIFDAV